MPSGSHPLHTPDDAPTDDAEARDLKAYYAARASEYEAIYAKPERQTDLRDIERWLASGLVGETVLEVACGTGYWTRFDRPVAASVVAIDASTETLRIAQARVAAGHVSFEVGDAYALPRGGTKFSAAFAGFWFSHVPLQRRREFLTQLDAALRPGARVILLDNLFVAGSSTAISEQDADGNTYQSRTLRDGSAHRVLRISPPKPSCASWPPLAAARAPRTGPGNTSGPSNIVWPTAEALDRDRHPRDTEDARPR